MLRPVQLLVLMFLLSTCGAPDPMIDQSDRAASTIAESQAATESLTARKARLRLATTTSTADSGLLDGILPDFEQRYNADVEYIALGTGQALKLGENGDADVLLVHARKQEDAFIKQGFGINRHEVMYNDFVIVGPAVDPAQISGMKTAQQAFKRIAAATSVFASRGDNSGTHTKELDIWHSAGITPTSEANWYKSLGQGMGEALIFANEQQAYTLTDRGTYLSMRDKLPNLSIIVGGATIDQNTDPDLINPYGVIQVNPDKHPGINAGLAATFIVWITSPEVQQRIGEFGRAQFNQPLFYPQARSE